MTSRSDDGCYIITPLTEFRPEIQLDMTVSKARNASYTLGPHDSNKLWAMTPTLPSDDDNTQYALILPDHVLTTLWSTTSVALIAIPSCLTFLCSILGTRRASSIECRLR